jgi:uncharacterized protein YpmB
MDAGPAACERRRMMKLLVLLAVIAVVVVLARALRSRSGAAHAHDVQESRAAKLAAEQATIARQGGQGMGQGGTGGGMGV